MPAFPPDSDAIAAVVKRGRSALAWEVLRRDPAYRRAWTRREGWSDTGIASAAEFTARWGLHFR